ncbi:MAG TPA: hypothetical protein VLV48_03390, partial [Thermoanaerobaculia bacterium]|nr:hypothetical protein [Thermoanaerobaculia bacterium]
MTRRSERFIGESFRGRARGLHPRITIDEYSHVTIDTYDGCEQPPAERLRCEGARVDWNVETGRLMKNATDLGPKTSDLRPQTLDLRPQTSDLRPQTVDLSDAEPDRYSALATR